MLVESMERPLSLLFTYRTYLLGSKRSPIVIKGSREWIEKYIPIGEFSELFGGYVLWREPKRKSKEMPGEGLGVWGRRNASKLRRILRERGAVFEVVEGEGPAQSVAIRSEGVVSQHRL